MTVKRKSVLILGCVLAFLFAVGAGSAAANIEAAKKWINEEFQPSTLTKEQQLKEMEWFINAAKPFKGMNIKVVSETIPTHEYEAKVLARAFREITGIQVSFDLIQEGDVIEKLQTQWASGQNIYDAWINDSDLIGTHARYGYVVPLSDFMVGEGKDVTLPTLDLDDFMGLSFTTGPAIRQPLLVPLRLVCPAGLKKTLQRNLRIRSGRAGQLVRL
jgi:glycerol transport system substrate-binding protein